jgi:sialate O-acetylesterase
MAKRVAPTLPIRSFKAPHRTANTPEARTPGEWRLASPATVGSFTAVGFWFGADLSKALEVPVGLVDVSWGGTRIEPWIPLDALSSHPRFKRVGDGMAQRIAEHAALTDEMKEERLARFNSAYARAAEQYWTKVLDGEPGMTAGWDKPEGAAGWPDAWKSVTLPANFSAIDPSLASYDGTVWFTREFEVPDSMARRACRIELGAIDDSDVVWCVEGRAGDRIGEWNAPRSYSVARGLPAGKQRLTVCVLDTSGEGGFIGRADEMRVVLADGSQSISLAGEWKWRQGARVPPVEAPQRRDPNTKPGVMPTDPAAIYNALVAPCIEFPARGVIWYQGESNAGEHENYRFLQPLLADSWRQKSGNPDLAWGVVQLAAFMKFVESEPAQGGWAWIRESQFRGIREAGGGMASAIDLGDADDIHPRRKREVGERLALWAKNRVYGDTTVAWQGPELSKCRRDGSKVVCEFDHADGLRATSGEPGGFALAGADGVFVWARATIQGTRVVLEAPGVTDPVEAVYAWQNNPERANLANGAGLPAVPFRSAVAAKD